MLPRNKKTGEYMRGPADGKKDPPKIIWVFCANKFGPWYKGPRKAKLQDAQRLGTDWWSDGNNVVVKEIGFHCRDGFLSFSHEDKKEVEKFMKGFNACRSLLKSFFE